MRGGDGDTGRSQQLRVSLPQEDREGQPRSARLPSPASRHWVRGNSGQLSLPSRPLPAAPGRSRPGPRPATVRAHGAAARTWVRARRLAGSSSSPLVLPGWAGAFTRRALAGLGCGDWKGTRGGLNSLSRGRSVAGRPRAGAGMGTQPRRERVTGFEPGARRAQSLGSFARVPISTAGPEPETAYPLVESGGSRLGHR